MVINGANGIFFKSDLLTIIKIEKKNKSTDRININNIKRSPPKYINSEINSLISPIPIKFLKFARTNKNIITTNDIIKLNSILHFNFIKPNKNIDKTI